MLRARNKMATALTSGTAGPRVQREFPDSLGGGAGSAAIIRAGPISRWVTVRRDLLRRRPTLQRSCVCRGLRTGKSWETIEMQVTVWNCGGLCFRASIAIALAILVSSGCGRSGPELPAQY